MGRVLAIIVAFLFWMSSDRSAYEVLSALILAWSLLVSWNQMVAFSKGRMARLVGMILISIVTFIYIITHNYFYDVLQNITTHATTPPTISVIISVVILIFGSLLSIWVARHRYSKTFAVLYVWLVNLGEARSKAIESHPNYLKKYL
ncbi:NADH dehydrogenase, subunit 5 [Staphylococcus aureus]|uniref:NADH dehydrogenase, subunit 5 n=9 Tax=Staphylococcus TaxID=1279 RepID=A0A380DJS6_STAAU|nr:NADH dehydrogenase, subunit 5 [Staphylococcus aureus]